MDTDENRFALDKSRRKALKKLAYIPPAVFTLSAMPFTASYGSGWSDKYKDKDKDKDKDKYKDK